MAFFQRSESPRHGVVWTRYPKNATGNPTVDSDGDTTDVT
jgi:hypothetical protein